MKTQDYNLISLIILVLSSETPKHCVHMFLATIIILSWPAMLTRQKVTSKAPTKDNDPGAWLHQMDSVTRLIKISEERNTAMRVGLPLMEMARVMVQ